MVIPTPIRRSSSTSIRLAIKREQIQTSKTGIHPNDVVNQAITEIQQNENLSGNGTAIASTTVPYLLQKRRELENKPAKNPDRDSSTHK